MTTMTSPQTERLSFRPAAADSVTHFKADFITRIPLAENPEEYRETGSEVVGVMQHPTDGDWVMIHVGNGHRVLDAIGGKEGAEIKAEWRFPTIEEAAQGVEDYMVQREERFARRARQEFARREAERLAFLAEREFTDHEVRLWEYGRAAMQRATVEVWEPRNKMSDTEGWLPLASIYGVDGVTKTDRRSREHLDGAYIKARDVSQDPQGGEDATHFRLALEAAEIVPRSWGSGGFEIIGFSEEGPGWHLRSFLSTDYVSSMTTLDGEKWDSMGHVGTFRKYRVTVWPPTPEIEFPGWTEDEED